MSTGTLNRRHQRNLNWLRNNPAVWRGYRLTVYVLRNIFCMMQVAGLYSYTTYPSDAYNVIRRHIKQLQQEEARVAIKGY